jgi:hypothetical protein
MTKPATDFPIPPDLALHAALAGSSLVSWALGATILFRSDTVALNKPIPIWSDADARLPPSQKNLRAVEMTGQAAAALRPWGDALRQAFQPLDLWTFSFATKEKIEATGAAIERDGDLAGTARAVQTFMR